MVAPAVVIGSLCRNKLIDHFGHGLDWSRQRKAGVALRALPEGQGAAVAEHLGRLDW